MKEIREITRDLITDINKLMDYVLLVVLTSLALGYGMVMLVLKTPADVSTQESKEIISDKTYTIESNTNIDTIFSIKESYFILVPSLEYKKLLAIQETPCLKYFIKDVEVSEKRFNELISSIDVCNE